MAIKNFFKKLLLFLSITNVHYIYLSEYRSLFEIQSNQILYIPEDLNQLRSIANNAIKKQWPISIVGAYKSQGGQTISCDPKSYRISLQKMNKVISLNVEQKEVTVQAGMTWKELQHYISLFGLSVWAMQSYNDFSIGGSLSVNVHGQDLIANPLIMSVKSFKLLTSTGEIVDVSRSKNNELFGLVIGGYGLFGIVIEVTLQLIDNDILQRQTKIINAKDLRDYFLKNIKNNNKIEFYSARFSIGSDCLLEDVIVLTYEKMDKSSKEYLPLNVLTNYCFLRTVMNLMKQFQTIKNIRFNMEKAYCKLPQVITRNNFMSSSIECLPSNKNNDYVLQEYFIPYKNLNIFIDYLKEIIKKYKINILNLTARHICKNDESILSYSSQECCALVLYFNIQKNVDEYAQILNWTRMLIDKTINLKGTFYLPYHLFATLEQIKKAYPYFDKFIGLKKYYDPNEIFTNMLYEYYCKNLNKPNV